MNRAAIDLGSNSVLLTIANPDGDLLHDEAQVVGLGQGLGDQGTLNPERVAVTLAALADYARKAGEFGIPPETIRLGATSAARRATDIGDFIERIALETGMQLHVISGENEARLSWLGATSEMSGEQLGVIDLGGGSTEVITGTTDGIASRVSLELGSARLTEAFLGRGLVSPESVEKLRAHVTETVTAHVGGAPAHAIALAGTATTLAAMDLHLSGWDSELVHSHTLSRVALAQIAEKLLALGPHQRRVLAAISPERADFLAAGAIVIESVLSQWNLEAATVSVRGLRFGILGATAWPLSL